MRMTSMIEDLINTRTPGMSLPQPFYTDPDIFERDFEQVFMRYWLFAGHSSQIPNLGDYFLSEIGSESVVISRSSHGTIQAFYNVCRHRGSRICTTQSGHVKSFVCPYHHWTYGLDGSLVSAKHMPQSFDKVQLGLHRAHVRVIEGLIFISLASEPPDFDLVERDISPHLRPHDLERAKICHKTHYDLHANWKLVAENSRECYHCPPAHAEYCRIMGFAAGVDSPRIADDDQVIQREREAHWKSLGMETRTVDFLSTTWHHAIRLSFRKGYVSQSLDGTAVAPLMGNLAERDMGALAIVIYPTFWFEASSDYAMIQRFMPAGPALTRVEMSWLVKENAQAGTDYEVDRVIAFWKATAEQDRKICEDNQAGVSSRRYQPGPYSSIESEVEKFVSWYLAQIGNR